MIDQQDRLDKHLIALGQELDELRRRLYVTVPLSEPRHRGWIRYFAIAEKIGAHKDRAMLQDILRVIGTQSWSRTPDFREWRRRKIPNRRRRALVEVELPFKAISASRWEQRNFPEVWKTYFRLEMARHKRLWHPTYVFAHRGLFEVRVEPLLVTEARVPDPVVQQRIAQIERWIRQRNLGPRLDWLRRARSYWRDVDWRSEAIDTAHAREMKSALKNYPEVDLGAMAHRIRINFWQVGLCCDVRL